MSKIYYVSGGAKSGKSAFAEKMVFAAHKKRIYIATAHIYDEEMQEKVRVHQKQRGEDWITLEAYKDLSLLLKEYTDKEYIILLDCLTNLVTNFMLSSHEDWEHISKEEIAEIQKKIEEEVCALLDFIKNSSLDLIVVSNELGMGLVPPYALGRHFRDIAGKINQLVAQRADKASFIVSGLELVLK